MVSRRALAVAVVAGVAAALIAGAAIAYAQSYALGRGAGNCKGWQPVPPPWSNATAIARWLPWLRGVVVKEFKNLIGPRVEVSEEYRSRVLEILSEDEDAAKLISEGYNVTAVKPIVKAYVAADRSVTLKASQALVTLVKKGEGVAVALVDLEQGKVVKLVVYSKTVIEK
ncbi:MAG: hypothetical protein LM571_01355 [Desulfurococcaceae archaeon]|nr:hypothetical protein [Desulfurococcaceae archaeon]